MKISLVMTSTGLGGVQQSLLPYALALKSLGHEVQIVVSRRAQTMTGVLREHGLENHTEHLEHTSKLFRYIPNPELRKLIRAFRPDLVLGFAQMGFLEARCSMRGSGIPVMTRVGTMKHRRMSRFRTADGWLATTSEMKAALMAQGFPEDRIFVVPNFLSVERSSRREHAMHVPPRVGSLGRFVARKGFHVLIDAIKLLAERGFAVECDIAGNGTEFAALKDRATKYGLAGQIRFPGWLEHGEKDEFLQGLDLFVCPSLDEPFGFAYLDAMRQGLPVVTTPTVGARHIFPSPDSARFVPFEDPPALADAVQDVLSNPVQRAALGHASAERFASGFCLEAGARNLNHTLERMQSLGKR